ncbi:TlpA family protein disulfide reductase [Confluentibacter sediminis]|uniref:TlpA family protein disulfide reductase n=1 Tax=Confluentibacter sediminis TaxID=2219045 RepID=UPI000DABEEB2|nr:TlpA disulfide reductase family protein [Confluentibacter sediminis]
MKHTLFLSALIVSFLSCKEDVLKDYVTLSGKIANQNSDSLVVFGNKGIVKTLKVAKDGTFSDTLKVEPSSYVLFDGKEKTSIYLKNGDDLNISIDTKLFDETITYTGRGAEANNYLAKKSLFLEKMMDLDTLLVLDEKAFSEKVKVNTETLEEMLSATKHLDSSFVANQKKEFEIIENQLLGMYKDNQRLSALKGNESPKFVDYENYSGGTTSLDDLKGKYVYIDMWATWCGPCKQEIPFLKEVERAYHGKNIEFVSISIDSQKDYEAWRTMVKEKELSGIQLYAKQDQNFAAAYSVNSIPRFILIDPKGMVVDANAPRPSSDELKNLLKTLDI